MSNIGFIGLGIMGESMCENIIKKRKEPVWVFDLNNDQVKKLVGLGAKAAESVRQIGEKCDYIIIMVPTGKNVTDVIENLLPVLKEGKIVIDMSTIEPMVSVVLAQKVRATGADMVDAPVVKSKDAAIAGELGIYVGGKAESYKAVKDILLCMGSNIIHMGENGKGLAMKICHNMLVAQIQNGVNEMIALAEASGLDYDQVVEAVGYGGGQNFYLDSKKNTIKAGDFSPKFSVANMNKDIHIAIELANEFGMKLKGAEAAKEVYQKAMDENLNGKDFSATIQVVRKMVKTN